MSKPEPKRVWLTADFLDLKTGMAYPAETILIRSPHAGPTTEAQYMLEGTKLGQECVAGFFLIRDICEPI